MDVIAGSEAQSWASHPSILPPIQRVNSQSRGSTAPPSKPGHGQPGPKIAQPVGPKHAVGPGLGWNLWSDSSNRPGLGWKNDDLLKARLKDFWPDRSGLGWKMHPDSRAGPILGRRIFSWAFSWPSPAQKMPMHISITPSAPFKYSAPLLCTHQHTLFCGDTNTLCSPPISPYFSALLALCQRAFGSSIPTNGRLRHRILIKEEERSC
jgi:hypothetical protein